MDPLIIGGIGGASVIVLLVLRVPIGFSLMLVGFVGIWCLKSSDAAYSTLVMTSYNTVSNFILIAVPLFIIMGFFAFYAKIPDRAYGSAFKMVGHMPGGLAMASSMGCGAFAAATGSSAATTATIGKVAVPEMRKYGYDPAFACSAVAGAGGMGILIPPSIILVVYGMITDLSIGKLLMAGLMPGLATIIAFMVVSYISARKNPTLAPRGPKTSLSEKLKSLPGLWGFALLISAVLGSIYAGVATPTEAAALGALLAFILGLRTFIKQPRELLNALVDTAVTTSMILVIMIGAMMFTYFLAIGRVPGHLTEIIVSSGLPPWGILALILLMYIPLGMFLDAMSMMLVTMPLAYPVLTGFGYDGIWFGIILVIMMEIGYITPPVGMNVFVIHGIVPDVPMEKIFAHCLRFIAGNIVVLVLCIVFPVIVTFLPSLMD